MNSHEKVLPGEVLAIVQHELDRAGHHKVAEALRIAALDMVNRHGPVERFVMVALDPVRKPS